MVTSVNRSMEKKSDIISQGIFVFYLSIYISIYLPICNLSIFHPSIHLPTYQSINQSVNLPIYQSTKQHQQLSLHQNSLTCKNNKSTAVSSSKLLTCKNNNQQLSIHRNFSPVCLQSCSTATLPPPASTACPTSPPPPSSPQGEWTTSQHYILGPS